MLSSSSLTHSALERDRRLLQDEVGPVSAAANSTVGAGGAEAAATKVPRQLKASFLQPRYSSVRNSCVLTLESARLFDEGRADDARRENLLRRRKFIECGTVEVVLGPPAQAPSRRP